MTRGVGSSKRRRVKERDYWICRYCGKPAETIDHVIPRSKGGGNGYENLVACCYDCNQKKADEIWEIWS